MANNDFQSTVELINKSENVLITTHTRPDGDACGSVVAMCDVLEALGKSVKPLILSPIPQWYEFLFTRHIPVLGEDIKLEDLTEGRFGNFDLIIIVDTNSYNQLPEFEKYLKKADTPILVIDHHVTSDGLGDVELLDSTAAATALIVYHLFKHTGWTITEKIAEALFVAAATDTGWFQFGNTDSRTLHKCAELIEAGAKPSKIYADLYQNFSKSRFMLMATVLNSLELHLDGRYAAMHITQRDFELTGAKYSDTENLINESQRIGTVKTSALFTELKDGRVRCSMRSRCDLDVSQIASKFGGGGHKQAAGTYLSGPMKSAKQLILEEIIKRKDLL
jgi:phosphoesterase RecJ-like protein